MRRTLTTLALAGLALAATAGPALAAPPDDVDRANPPATCTANALTNVVRYWIAGDDLDPARGVAAGSADGHAYGPGWATLYLDTDSKYGRCHPNEPAVTYEPRTR